MQGRGRHRSDEESGRTKAVVVVGAALALGLVASGATFSAFTAQTSNANNSFTADTVTIADNDANGFMFNLANMRPGNPVSKCIQVTYTGTGTSAVKLYGTTTGGTGLESYLQLSVVRGTMAPGTFPGCAGFAADAGGGVLYTGLVSAYPNSAATGTADPNATWAANESHYYKFTVDLADDMTAEGKTATESFVWFAS